MPTTYKAPLSAVLEKAVVCVWVAPVVTSPDCGGMLPPLLTQMNLVTLPELTRLLDETLFPLLVVDSAWLEDTEIVSPSACQNDPLSPMRAHGAPHLVVKLDIAPRQ